MVLNEELLEEKEAHQFTRMSREEKIEFLSWKIGEMKDKLEERERCVMELRI